MHTFVFLLPVAVVVQIVQFVQHVHLCVCVSIVWTTSFEVNDL